MFQYTTAIDKLRHLNARRKIIQGGTYAGKTFGIIAVLIDFLTSNPREDCTVVAETIPSIKKGALKDFKDIMLESERWIQEHYNATDRRYSFANGSSIEFNSFDSVGTAQASGKRKNLFLNEAYYIPFDIADTLMTRTSGNIWIDFNPTSEFWAHTEIMGKEDTEFIIMTYLDNEALPTTVLKDLEEKREKAKTSAYWSNWCRVYLDGEIGSYEGTLFNRYELKRFSLKKLLNDRVRKNDQVYKLGYWDVADKGTDNLCGIIAEVSENGVYVTDVIFSPDTVTTTLPSSFDMIIKENPIYCRIESNNMGSTFAAWLREQLAKTDCKTKILDVNNSQKKHTRILMQEGFINEYVHFVCEDELVHGSDYYKFMKELCKYKKDGTGKNEDDAPDAMSGLSLMCKSFRPDLFI